MNQRRKYELLLVLIFVSTGWAESANKPVLSTAPVLKQQVPASLCRPLAPTSEPKLKPLLDRFVCPPQAFSYQMCQVGENEAATIWRVLFPSPHVSSLPANNTVWCEYYRAKIKGPRPAVVVLHPLDLEIHLMRKICSLLAQKGIDSLWLEMAYYGDRSVPEGIFRQILLLQDLDNLIAAVCQSVMDIRRASEFLAGRPDVPKDQIYLMGCSLGAIIAALTMGVDGNYPKVVMLVGGGNLSKIFTANRETIQLLSLGNKEKNLSEKMLYDRLKPIEPLTYVDRARKTKVLMLNARKDTIIPSHCAQELADRLPGARIKWYDGGHTAIPVDEETVRTITDFFRGKAR